MRYLKIPTVLHDGEIHSIDINSENSKIVSCGKDKLVLIWNLTEFINLNNQVLNNANLEDFSVILSKMKPIKQFDDHDSLVNIAKWSPESENVLVSGDIEGRLYLHNLLDGRSKLIFPSSKKVNTSSIIDLSWSSDGRLIAWSTSDSRIHIFDTVKSTYQELTTLTHLEKLVIQRSLAFDPTNNYLVTLGDDTLIYIYQFQYDLSTSNYQFRLIHKVSKLINKNSLNAKYRRISWSPDGEFVSIPTASKSTTSLVSLISRSKNWQNIISLVGHDYNCEVVKFNPNIFSVSSNESQMFNVIATAGSDKTLVIWNTSKDSPIITLKNIVDSPIVDLCWSKSGNALFSASLDGYLSILQFEENELGVEISRKSFTELVNSGKDYIKPMDCKYEHEQPTNKRSSSTAQVELLDQKDAIRISDEMTTLSDDDEDKEQTDKINIENNNNKAEAQIKGDIIPEIISPSRMKELESPASGLLRPVMDNKQTKISSKGGKTKIQPQKPLSLQKQKITTKNGKKRVQPILISNSGVANNISKEPTSSIANGSSSSFSRSLMEFDKPSYSVSEGFYKQNKRLKAQDENTSNKKMKRELEPVKFIGSVLVNPNTTFSKVRLSVPKIRLAFQLQSKLEDNEQFVLDIKNGTGNETKPSRITYFKKDKLIWSDFIPRFIQLATEGSQFWALSTADGQILTYSHTSGKRILPPIILGSPLSFLENHEKYLMAVTSVGELYVWNLDDKKILLSSNLSPLLELTNKFQEDGLSKSDNITMCSITSNGIPLVTLSNGSGYLYNKDLCVWQTITESWWAFGSHYWDSNDENTKKPQTSSLFNDESSIIGLLEHKTNEEILRKTRTGRGKYFNKISKNMIMKEGFENLENTISISHLENRILCCEILGEHNDFKKFFITYVQRICELGFKAKLFEICNQLLGPVNDEKDISKWESKICGLDKHELLKEVILVCAKNRDSQRILIHFGKKVKLLDDDFSV